MNRFTVLSHRGPHKPGDVIPVIEMDCNDRESSTIFKLLGLRLCKILKHIEGNLYEAEECEKPKAPINKEK